MDFAKIFNLKIPREINERDRLLVIDDQQDMRIILVHHLHKLNYPNVIQCKEGMEALEILHKEKISLILCRMDLPQMTGLDLLSEIREDLRIDRPPFCITMANVNKEKLMFAVETGIDEIIVSPFALDDIGPKLHKSFLSFHNPRNPEKVYELAKRKHRNNELDESERIYELLHQSAPGSARPLVGLAKIALARQQLDEAMSYTIEAEKQNKNYVHLHALRGDVYMAQTQVDQAVNCYKMAIELSPLNPNRYKTAADILYNAEGYEETIELLKIALSKEVSFSELYFYLGQSYYHLRDYSNSAKYIRKAIFDDPSNVVYINQLALSLKESGDLEEAKKYYNMAIKIDPDNKQALFNKAIMLAQAGKNDDAIRILERVLKKYPDFEKGAHKLEELKALASARS